MLVVYSVFTYSSRKKLGEQRTLSNLDRSFMTFTFVIKFFVFHFLSREQSRHFLKFFGLLIVEDTKNYFREYRAVNVKKTCLHF